MADSPWPTIHAERTALLDDLRGLTPEQWSTPSLCRGWTVEDAFGHIIATARKTPGGFVGSFLKAGFRFQTMVAHDIARETEGGPAQELAAFAPLTTATTAPPGPVDSWLGETLVHAEDIRRPLGIPHTYPTDAVVRVARFYSGSNTLIGSKDRIAGLRLVATDADLALGSGPEVSGPALSLLLAMTGRRAATAELSGPGVETLASRP